MNTSATKIAKFINENVSLQRNQMVTIYEGPKGLVYTRGSMEYRDNDHKQIMIFKTGDEVPNSLAALKRSIEFQMKGIMKTIEKILEEAPDKLSEYANNELQLLPINILKSVEQTFNQYEDEAEAWQWLEREVGL
jgi:hypothetical protein